MAGKKIVISQIHIRAEKPEAERRKALKVWEKFLQIVAADQDWQIVPEGLVTVRGHRCYRYKVEVTERKAYHIMGHPEMPALRA